MNTLHPNWKALADQGVEASSHAGAYSTEFNGVPKELAIRIAHSIIVSLNTLNSWQGRRPYRMEQLLSELLQNEGYREFETRPADRNCAVRIIDELGSYTVKVDARNDFEDYPEQGGPLKMQQKIIEAIETMPM